MAVLDAVSMALALIAAAGGLVLLVHSTYALRAGRGGHRAVLLWAVSLLVLLVWPHVTRSLDLSVPAGRVTSHLRAMLSGAWVMYGISYVVPFLGRDRRQVRAARKRARQESGQ